MAPLVSYRWITLGAKLHFTWHIPSPFLAPVREKTVPVLKKMGEEREKVEVGE